MLPLYRAPRYTVYMLSLTSLSVIAIRDFWVELLKDGVYNDIAFSIVSTDVSTSNNISLKDAQDVVRFSLNQMGVTI